MCFSFHRVARVSCPLVHWSIGPLVSWSLGPLVHWSIVPVVHWLNVRCHMFCNRKIKTIAIFDFMKRKAKRQRAEPTLCWVLAEPPPPYPTTARSWLLNAGFSSYSLLALSSLFKPAAFPSCSHSLGCTTALPLTDGSIMQLSEMG